MVPEFDRLMLRRAAVAATAIASGRGSMGMAEIINLRTARKARARAEAAAKAAENRVAFCRTKAEKQAARDEIARRAKLLDGAKRETVDDSQPDVEPR